MLQYAYGSYGSSTDPRFNGPVVSLLDRGMVYAIAHIRGGQEMGRKWYDDGKLFHKKNTFTDFIDVTDDLVRQGYAAKDRVAAYGGSAGGLLMGAISNMAPDQLPRDPLAGAVRRRGDDHARSDHPAHHQRVRRVGQSGEEGLLRLHARRTRRTTTCRSRPTRRCSSAPACGIRRCSTGSRPSTWRACATWTRASEPGACSAPTWTPATAAKSGRFRRYRELSEMYAFMLDQLGLADAPAATGVAE